MEKQKWSSNIFEVYKKWKRIHQIEVDQFRLKRVLSINNRESNYYDAFSCLKNVPIITRNKLSYKTSKSHCYLSMKKREKKKVNVPSIYSCHADRATLDSFERAEPWDLVGIIFHLCIPN